MSLVDILKCPRGGLHVFRFGTCANCRIPESEWRKRTSALDSPRSATGAWVILQGYYVGLSFLNTAVLLSVLGGMAHQESSYVRVYYALVATVLLTTLLVAMRQSGLIFWLLSDPSEGQ